MALESREAPEALRRQVRSSPLWELAARLRQRPPQVVVTCARGSSAHAATFGKHLLERHLGIPVAAAAPSIASLYRRPLRLDGQLFIAISQAGRSADVIESAAMARSSGATTVAVVNDADSPLARACEVILPIEAGAELSVAATKTFMASLALLLRLVAVWKGDVAMQRAVDRLPERLAQAADLDWSAAAACVAAADSLITIGRGPTLAIAREAALKLKEICNIHAEPFSSAEFQHGPMALVQSSYPVMLFVPQDAAAEGFAELAFGLERKGAATFAAGASVAGAFNLPGLEPDHPDADAVCLVQSFYQLVILAALRRGRDVDRPRHLQKVTRTR
jgi:glucosamine--fructose-6-phosphate aminotransferase (isomerizing)